LIAHFSWKDYALPEEEVRYNEAEKYHSRRNREQSQNDKESSSHIV